MGIHKRTHGHTAENAEVNLYTLENFRGVTASVSTFGAILVSLRAPDRNGKIEEITLGFDELAGYLGPHPYFGATVGRFANRIGYARFSLDGKEYRLEANDDGHHLHGGVRGFDKILWQEADCSESPAGDRVRLTYLSPAGEEHYPGNLDVSVTYTLTADNRLCILLEATTDAATPINLTNHAYFNLRGHGDVLGHVLQLWADRYTAVNQALIPNGEIVPVAGTPLDFTRPRSIGERIDRIEGGYDHNYVLNKPPGELSRAARVFEPETGRVLELFTTEPGLQLYTGNFLDGTLAGRGGTAYARHAGLCLEPQKYPDSPNHPNFPDCILRPGQNYRHEIVFALATE